MMKINENEYQALSSFKRDWLIFKEKVKTFYQRNLLANKFIKCQNPFYLKLFNKNL